jgi:hypothetical protein
MIKRNILFVLAMFVLIPAYAQYITGKVIADDDGMPLVGATVWYEENPAAKVRVGEDGLYRIRFRKGTLVYHCFGFKQYKTEVTKLRTINVSLKPSSLDMEELVVEAKKKKYSRKNNPAVELMQKVIAAKKSRDMRMNDYASYNKYARTMMALNEFTVEMLDSNETLKNKAFLVNYAELCPETGKIIVPISIEEKMSTELYRKSDGKNKSVVHGHHAESLLDVLAAGEFMETKFKDNLKDVDIYKDEMVLLEHNFISPIGGNPAIRFYHYALGDTVDLDGDKCIKVAFSPANVQDFGFSGYLYVLADSTYRVRRAKFGVPVANGINFVETMDVDQEYISLPSGEQICHKNRMLMQLKLTSYVSKIFVDYNVTYSDWSFDPIPDDEIEFLGDERYEKDAKSKTNDYWLQARPDTLSYAQANVAEMKRRFVDQPAVKAMIYGMRVVLDNYLETSTNPNNPSKFVIGPFTSIVGSSWAEGFHVRLGLQTTGAFNKHWFVKAWAKYGFRDRRPKGHAELIYSFNEKDKVVIAYPIRTLSVSYTNDIQSPTDKFMQYDKDNAFMAIAWNTTHLQSYYDRYRFKYDWEFNNGLRLTAIFNRESNRGTGDLYFNTLKEWDDAREIQADVENKMGTQVQLDNIMHSNRIVYTDFQFGAEFQPGVKYLNNKNTRFLANREAPIYGIHHTVGVKGLLGGDYNYNHTELTFKKRFWLKSWGSIDAFHSAQFQWNTVPFQLLCLPRANLSYMRNDNTFSLVKNMEFLNDRTLTIMYRWDLNGKLFNRIPLIKKLKLREAIGFNMMWGYLTDKNNPYRFNDITRYPDEASKMADPGYDYLFQLPGEWVMQENGIKTYQPVTQVMNSWKPYVEVSVGIHNLFKFFSLDYYHRLTYCRPDTQKWGLRFAFEATF